MNYRRGFWRLWATVSLLWASYMAAVTYRSPGLDWGVILMPPLVFLAVGALIAWALRGFTQAR